MTQHNDDLLLDVRDLKVTIRTDDGPAQVLDGVDLAIPRGQIVGVVGESGCGKTTLVRTILGTLPSTARVEEGQVLFEGSDLLALSDREMTKKIRGKKISFIPQDPYLAFNPVFKVGTQLLEIMRWHGPNRLGGGARSTKRSARDLDRDRLVELLRIVQIPDPVGCLDRYPHQFSGGQRQRLLIAGSLACNPSLVIADEPTTALDVTTQLQILKLLKSLAQELQISMMFVTHDFGVVAQLCDRVSVMYAGQSVEFGTTEDCLNNPQHPYTQKLIGCHPDRSDDLAGIPGSVPSPIAPPPGCRFHPRCDMATPVCASRKPATVELDASHRVDCVLFDNGAPADAAQMPLHG